MADYLRDWWRFALRVVRDGDGLLCDMAEARHLGLKGHAAIRYLTAEGGDGNSATR